MISVIRLHSVRIELALNKVIVFYHILLTVCTWLQFVSAAGIQPCIYDIGIEPYRDRSRG